MCLVISTEICVPSKVGKIIAKGANESPIYTKLHVLIAFRSSAVL